MPPKAPPTPISSSPKIPKSHTIPKAATIALPRQGTAIYPTPYDDKPISGKDTLNLYRPEYSQEKPYNPQYVSVHRTPRLSPAERPAHPGCFQSLYLVNPSVGNLPSRFSQKGYNKRRCHRIKRHVPYDKPHRYNLAMEQNTQVMTYGENNTN